MCMYVYMQILHIVQTLDARITSKDLGGSEPKSFTRQTISN